MKNPENPQKSNAASAFIEKMTAIGNGWDVSPINHNAIGVDRAYLYVFDFDSGHLWMTCVSFQSFKELVLEVRDAGHPPSSTINQLDLYLTLMLFERSLPSIDDSNGLDDPIQKEIELTETDVDLANLVAQFAGTTDMIFDDGMLEPLCHFLAIRYTQELEGNVFRSIVIPSSTANCRSALPTIELQNYISQMLVQDHKRNPEWFAWGCGHFFLSAHAFCCCSW